MVVTIGVRGPTLARLATVSVLVSIGNTPALRVTRTTLGGVVPFFVGSLLFSYLTVSVLLFEKEEYFHSTSHSSFSKSHTETVA